MAENLIIRIIMESIATQVILISHGLEQFTPFYESLRDL